MGIANGANFGNLKIDGVAAFAAYQGAAYGGKPIATGETTWMRSPEFSLWLRDTLAQTSKAEFDLGGTAMGGTLAVLPAGRLTFADLYERYGLLAHGSYGNLDFQAEQWYGDDHDADGLLTNQHSSGGYVRLKYYPIPHAYLGIRYDATCLSIRSKWVSRSPRPNSSPRRRYMTSPHCLASSRF